MLDIFNDDAFSVTSLTDAVNHMPFVPGRLGELGLFEERGVQTTTITVEEMNGTLQLVQSRPRGAPIVQVANEKRTARFFSTVHLPRERTLMADSIQNIRAFGSSDQVKTLQGEINYMLADQVADLDATLEWHRVGALKGIILDADGATLYNLFTEFGVVQQTEGFALPTAGTDVRGKCMSAARKVEDALGNGRYLRLHAMCGDGFFDALVSHPNVKEAYEGWAAAEMRLGGDMRRGFEFGGITFENYRGKNGGTPYIPTDDAYIFPVGTPGLFVTRFAPGDFIETVNTIGLPRYAKIGQDPSGMGRFVTVHTQSNPISLCTKPRAVVRATRV